MQEALHASGSSGELIEVAFEEQQVTAAVQLSVTRTKCISAQAATYCFWLVMHAQ